MEEEEGAGGSKQQQQEKLLGEVKPKTRRKKTTKSKKSVRQKMSRQWRNDQNSDSCCEAGKPLELKWSGKTRENTRVTTIAWKQGLIVTGLTEIKKIMLNFIHTFVQTYFNIRWNKEIP